MYELPIIGKDKKNSVSSGVLDKILKVLDKENY